MSGYRWRTPAMAVESRPVGRRPCKAEDLKGEAVSAFMEELASGFGPLHSVRHSAVLSETPAFWERPAMPLGSHQPQWPARRKACVRLEAHADF